MASKFLNLSTDTTLGGNAPSDELAVSQKAIKAYVDTEDAKKLDKTTSNYKIYGTNGSGGQTTYTLSSQATPSSMAYRIAGSGALLVGTPSADAHATTKKYVDDALATKQDALVSGTNIKTINGTSVLGFGDISTTELPSQSGQSGKFLTTNGTTVSWATVGGGGSSTLSGLSDVTITSATSGQALTYDGSGWINSTIYTMQIVDYTA